MLSKILAQFESFNPYNKWLFAYIDENKLHLNGLTGVINRFIIQDEPNLYHFPLDIHNLLHFNVCHTSIF